MSGAGGDRGGAGGSRRWLLLLAAMWLLASFWLIAGWWHAIAMLALPDSDDNLRLLQVRDWLAGQGWFDLRQHRLAPAGGADIHWSRLVDLPLAGVILLVRPFAGVAIAETISVVLVPLLTLFTAMLLVALIARRLIAPSSWPFTAAMLLMASPAVGMMSPLRIDHHGWQIVLLLTMLMGLISDRRVSGGAMAGLAIAASLVIGVEMLPYLGLGVLLAGAAWIIDGGEMPRLRALAVALPIGTLIGCTAFVAPEMRWTFACDALSAAWAGPLLLGSALLFGMTLLPLGLPAQRAAAVLFAGGTAVALLMMTRAACIIDPYHAVDPEARRIWLGRVSEALPLYAQGANDALAILVLPLIGLAGAIVMIRRSGNDRARLRGWLLIAALSIFSLLLALAQTRAAVTAQAVAAPGAGALLFIGWRHIQRNGHMLIRVFGTVLLFLCVSGLVPRLAINALAAERPSPSAQQANAVSARCLDPRTMAALDRLPPATLLAPIDLTTPLLVHTHHSGLAGPYHRNGRVIAEVTDAWSRKPDYARDVMRRHGARYLVACGHDAEASAYAARNPAGLQARLDRGDVPAWLVPVKLDETPWRVWRVKQISVAH